MRVRTVLQVLVATTCLTLGVIAPAPASAAPSDGAPSDVARLAALGIDITKYKPGWKIVGKEVHWEKEQAVLSLEPMLISDCPSGWVCLFENVNFNDQNHDGRTDPGTRMLRFSATGRWLYMATWNFNDKMSSWYNRRGLDARWYHNAWPQDPPPALCMNPGATASYAGSDHNDKMSMLWIYTNTTTCP